MIHEAYRIYQFEVKDKMSQISLFAKSLWMPEKGLSPYRLVADNGAWVSCEPAEEPQATDLQVLDGIVVPGLVDLHTHIGEGSNPFAIGTDVLLSTGVTTGCSQGDVGHENIDSWIWQTRPDAPHARGLLAINLAPFGEKDGMSGLELVNSSTVQQTVKAAERYSDEVRMVSVNLSERSLGRAKAGTMFQYALELRKRLSLPLMIGLAPEKILPLRTQLDGLIHGDIVTYCYRSTPWTLFPGGRPIDGVVEARDRGVLFDVGHGKSSFDRQVAKASITAGFLPDTISSDIQAATTLSNKTINLVTVMQLVWECGAPLKHVLEASTITPARVLGLTDGTGDTMVGARADLSFLDISVPQWIGRPIIANGIPTASKSHHRLIALEQSIKHE
jgi:dihydroorotase